jgi:hypothetical protein
MSISLEKLTEAALALPSEARALLADRLVESLVPLDDEAIRAAWVAEALWRREEVASGAVKAIRAGVVLAEARRGIRDVSAETSG